MLEAQKQEINGKRAENSAEAYCETKSACLELFEKIDMLRREDEREITERFARAYEEDPDLAMRILFYSRDVRGGLGERYVFRTCLRWLAENLPASMRKNIALIPEYGRWDDLFVLEGTPCEYRMMHLIRRQLHADLKAVEKGENVSLLGKWMPSPNASNGKTISRAKRFAVWLGMSEPEYRRTLVKLRKHIRIIENNLRERDYTFDYAAQPSKALHKYREAFGNHDGERYREYLSRVVRGEVRIHTGTLVPYEIVAQIVGPIRLSQEERERLDVTWKTLMDCADGENALVVADCSGSMYWSKKPVPACVALSMGIYFAERNKGAFHDRFITFASEPQLIEVQGRDIADKVEYCRSFRDCGSTDIRKVFELVLSAAVKHRVPQEEMPAKLYFITDMEYGACRGTCAADFEYAKKIYAQYGYSLPRVVFWNVDIRDRKQTVTQNEQGIVMIHGCSSHIFRMIRSGAYTPYEFMIETLSKGRYRDIAA